MNRLPRPLREEWSGRASNGVVFLGLRDAYRLLGALGDDLGRRFADSGLDDDKRSPLVARNQSILAHGSEPVSNRAYNQLHEMLGTLASLNDQDGNDWLLPAPC